MNERYEFETRRWLRLKNDRGHSECVVASVRTGWTVHGYEARLYVAGHLAYRSSVFLTRELANQEADQLLYEAISPIRTACGSVTSELGTRR